MTVIEIKPHRWGLIAARGSIILAGRRDSDGHDPARTDKARQVVAGAGKNILDYVIRRFNASLAELKSSWAGPPLESRLTRSPDPTGAPSQPKRGCCSKRLV